MSSGQESRKRKRQEQNTKIPLRTYRIENVGKCKLSRLLELLESGNINLMCGPNHIKIAQRLLGGVAHINIYCKYPSSRITPGDDDDVVVDKKQPETPQQEIYVMVIEKSNFKKSLNVMKSENVAFVTIRIFEDEIKVSAYNQKFELEFNATIAASVSTDEMILRDRGAEIRYSQILFLPGKKIAEKITDAGKELSIWHEPEFNRLRFSTQSQSKDLNLAGYLDLPNPDQLKLLLKEQEEEIKEALLLAGEDAEALDAYNPHEDQEYRESLGQNATTLLNKFIAIFKGDQHKVRIKFELGCPMALSGKVSNEESVSMFIAGKILEDD